MDDLPATPVPDAPPPINPALSDQRLSVFLAHADRCWKAEEVNATRIAARTNLVLTGVTAVLGLKLYSATAEIRTMIEANHGPLGAWTLAFWIPAALGLAGMLLCLGIVLEVKWSAITGNGTPLASRLLQLNEQQWTSPESVPKDSIERDAFRYVYAAALALHKRNTKRNRLLSQAQAIFFLSAILLFISLTAYGVIHYSETTPAAQIRRESAP
jgi:hypothetical protein